ncbi:putative Glyoxalase/Bleomycin resistance protein/Dioxygenase superfamily [Leishmania naiffi]|uniref:Methylmalonyl-CoA epimerase, mitochondrial n=1 Tax=Leishmania naiffi TaxID=5678 RepID=A0AAW3BIQ0_9TRYP
MFRRSIASLAVPANLGRLHHVAIAVPVSRSIVEAGEVYKRLFNANVSDPVRQEEHGVITVFVEMPNSKIELLHPLGNNSPIAAFLERNKDGGLHHICVEVADLSAAMLNCKEANIRCLGAKPKIGAHGNPVIFLHPKDCGGVLIELEEVKP